MTTKSFSFTPRVLAHFGDELIRNEAIALTELVKNAYDAFATKCKVTFYFDPNKKKEFLPIRIDIQDNGTGMTSDDIVNHWLTVGTDNKQKIIDEYKSCPDKATRLPLGEKGIGRLGVHKLGEKVTLITKTKSSEAIKLEIDWSNLSTAKKLEDFNFPIKPYKGNFERNSGVTIRIENLRKKAGWTRGKLRSIFRAITALNMSFSEEDCRLLSSPRANNFLAHSKAIQSTSDEFKVSVASEGNDTIFAGLKSFDDIKQSALYECDILLEGDRITDFEYNFNPWPSISENFPPRKVSFDELTPIERNLQRLKEKEDEEDARNPLLKSKKFVDVDLADVEIGQIYVKIYVFEQTTSITKHLDARGAVKDYLQENCGVRVYRDGIRVYDYGEKGNDWLGLTAVGSIGEKLRNEHTLGFVFLDRKSSLDLIEKTNREGFIENVAYKKFVQALQWAITYVFLERRNRDKRHLAEFYGKTVEPVVTLLSEAAEYIQANVEDDSQKKELTAFVYKIEKEYKHIIGRLYQSAGIGVLSHSIIHELEKVIKEINAIFDSGEDFDKARKAVRQLDETLKKFSFLVKPSEIKKTETSKLFANAYRFLRMRIKNHSIDLMKEFEQSDFKCKASLTHATNIILNVFDNSIYWLNNTKDFGKRIVVAVTDSLETGYISMIIADNGPGFPDDPHYLIKPFVSTKPMAIGSGLGLYIADELMTGMGGKITFPDFETVSNHIDNDLAFAKGAIVSLNFKSK
ncbi:sensor histidine kinase [Desulfovibrio oxyclinae]|uniref:sensor histidine kinase n=1 Tax=Desulfovibrio oxyclinae TaxID=63560 RepID=UPI00036AE497|nr:sensor histidine kinase [Desulfovibrio oxyclinae]